FADQQVLHHLLGDCGPALRPARVRKIADESADQRPRIDALVLEEALVLRGDESLLDMRGNFGKVDPDPALVRFIDLGEAFALDVKDRGLAWQPQTFEAGMVRPNRPPPPVEREEPGQLARGNWLPLTL